MSHGLFEVIGRRQYRGHPTGTRFESKIDARTHRACARGDIRLVEEIVPDLEPGSYRLPRDWPPGGADTHDESRAPAGALLIEGGGK